MLVRLYSANYGAFRDGFDLSLEATDLGSDEDRGYFEVIIDGEDRPLRLLRLAAIYGPNASGKSTIIEAARALFDLAIFSGPLAQRDEGISGYNPFKLDRTTSSRPCRLGCEVVVGRTVVDYSIEFDGERIIAEQARTLQDPPNEDSTIFTRDRDSRVRVYAKQSTAVDLSEVTRPNASVLSVAAQLNQAAFLPLFDAVRSSLLQVQTNAESVPIKRSIARRLHKSEHFRSWVVERLLKPADIGIIDVSTKEVKVSHEPVHRTYRPVFTHRGVNGDFTLNLADQSAGTQKMLALADTWYRVIHDNAAAFVDELSASLHPALLNALLDAFNTVGRSRSCQLVFTSHDLTPLESVLRRDQVYFTEKNDSGVATLFSLADFRERNNVNLRKRYLEGRYGAVPHLFLLEGLLEDEETR